MLRFLSIARLAIIDAVQVEFGPGLNVLTGETGAGKSIVVGALDLLLGGRASPDLIRSGEDNAKVEAILETPDGREVLVRREIVASGRSRAYLNGDLVTTAALRAVTSPLVDLHGQHDHQTLLDPASHLALLDAFIGFDTELNGVATAFDAWSTSRNALEASQMDERERAARLDLVEFQLAEIERVAPKPGEDDELSATRHLLANADRLHRLCSDAYEDLYEGEGAVLEKLGRVWKRVGELATLDAAFEGYVASREAVTSQLQDLALALRGRTTRLDASPERLQVVEDRLAALERLKKRHGPDLAQVLDKQARLYLERDLLTHGTQRVEELKAMADQCRSQFLQLARSLSARRRAAAGEFARALGVELDALAMPSARCGLLFSSDPLPEAGWTRAGIDTGELHLTANPGEAPRPLARIASGGELSRVMLALKTLATTDQPGKTLIFDEVDAGIGGRAADAVGARLRHLGKNFQVLCITHLPQVAAHAHVHYRVSKSVRNGRTLTTVDQLTAEARVEEVGRMMVGDVLSPAVLAGARDLIALKAKGEQVTKGESESRSAKPRSGGRK